MLYLINKIIHKVFLENQTTIGQCHFMALLERLFLYIPNIY